MQSPNPLRRNHHALAAVSLIALMLPTATTLAYPFGSATCDASMAAVDGMFDRGRHPGEHGGFELAFSRPDYYPGETLAVTLRHTGTEVFRGFLLYAETSDPFRRGLFTPIVGTTLSGGLPSGCANDGHTITHDLTQFSGYRSQLRLAWTAVSAPETLTFRALVLRADPMLMQRPGTDFYEVTAVLPASVDGIFRSKFESIP